MGVLDFHNYSKWDDFYYHEWKFKFQKVELNVFSAEIRVHFHFQSERDSSCVYTHYYQSIPPIPVHTLYKRPLTPHMVYFLLYHIDLSDCPRHSSSFWFAKGHLFKKSSH